MIITLSPLRACSSERSLHQSHASQSLFTSVAMPTLLETEFLSLQQKKHFPIHHAPL